MNDVLTRTRLRKGLVRKKSRRDENGVSNEELDILLADASEEEARCRKPSCRETGRKRKKTSRKNATR